MADQISRRQRRLNREWGVRSGGIKKLAVTYTIDLAKDCEEFRRWLDETDQNDEYKAFLSKDQEA